MRLYTYEFCLTNFEKIVFKENPMGITVEKNKRKYTNQCLPNSEVYSEYSGVW